MADQLPVPQLVKPRPGLAGSGANLGSFTLGISLRAQTLAAARVDLRFRNENLWEKLGASGPMVEFCMSTT